MNVSDATLNRLPVVNGSAIAVDSCSRSPLYLFSYLRKTDVALSLLRMPIQDCRERLADLASWCDKLVQRAFPVLALELCELLCSAVRRPRTGVSNEIVAKRPRWSF